MKKQSGQSSTTLISKSTVIQGDIHFSGALEIEGKVVGSITAEDDESAEVRVRESGVVKGEISVPSLIVNGVIEGDVRASQHLEMAAKARVIGNVYYTSMEMVMGAEINGNLHREDGQEIKRLSQDKAE